MIDVESTQGCNVIEIIRLCGYDVINGGGKIFTQEVPLVKSTKRSVTGFTQNQCTVEDIILS